MSPDDGRIRQTGPSLSAPNASFYHPFACELFRQLAAEGGNLLLSPHAISRSLALLRAGAAGETARQIDRLLPLPADAPRVYQDLAEALETSPSVPAAARAGDRPQGETPGILDGQMLPETAEYSLSIAGGVFVSRSLDMTGRFRRSCAADFAAALHAIDFEHPEEARTAINRWALERTNGRVADMVPPGMPASGTRMLLAEATYFKASWDEPFEESRTENGKFRVGPDRTVLTRRMRRTGRMNYGVARGVRLVEIPYRLGGASMLVVLPQSKNGLDRLVEGLTSEKLRSWIAALKEREVALELPRFGFGSELQLSAALERMGMSDAFSPERADFSGIAPEKPLFAGAVLQGGHIAVDEKGTEAAAVTFWTVLAGVESDRPVAFIVDHPFLFLIWHRQTEAILFIGRVVDPTAT